MHPDSLMWWDQNIIDNEIMSNQPLAFTLSLANTTLGNMVKIIRCLANPVTFTLRDSYSCPSQINNDTSTQKSF